ncbi:hypothetical protein [Streptomyces sp. NPDC059943]|uniref:hypothetical protein n=1 Tax=Streptomyces sp. NPDC059943 TaxID=3347010 RepID=UPI00365F004E
MRPISLDAARAGVMGDVCALVTAWLLLVNVRRVVDDEGAFRAAVSCESGDDRLRTAGARSVQGGGR